VVKFILVEVLNPLFLQTPLIGSSNRANSAVYLAGNYPKTLNYLRIS
jgi:hypothetical protein